MLFIFSQLALKNHLLTPEFTVLNGGWSQGLWSNWLQFIQTLVLCSWHPQGGCYYQVKALCNSAAY